MPFAIRPYGRFPVQCFLTSYGFVRWVEGFVLLVLVTSGCTEWTIPPCKGTQFTTPCVGPCTMDAEPTVPNYTQMTIPLAVVIQDKYGKLHCQEIQP